MKKATAVEDQVQQQREQQTEVGHQLRTKFEKEERGQRERETKQRRCWRASMTITTLAKIGKQAEVIGDIIAPAYTVTVK